MEIKIYMSDRDFTDWRAYLEREGYVSKDAHDTLAIRHAMEVVEMNPNYVEVNRDDKFPWKTPLKDSSHIHVDCCDTCYMWSTNKRIDNNCDIHKRNSHFYIPTDMYVCSSYTKDG